MKIYRGLATSRNLETTFISDLIAASSGIISGSSAALMVSGIDNIRISVTNTSTEKMRVSISGVNDASGKYVTLLSGNANAESLAYEIRKAASGDVLVKFVQWVSSQPLDVMAETFQSWGIAAYTVSNDSLLKVHRLGENDLFSGASYGGFLLHQMKHSGWGLTIFNRDSLAPLFTWCDSSLWPTDDTKVFYSKGMATYTEMKKRFYGALSDNSGYRLLIQEPYNRPKRPEYAVLAPIFSPATSGDYSKYSRWLIQAPHRYNPFDSDGYLLIDGGEKGAFYCDHGVCLSAKGDKIVDTGNRLPDPEPWLYYKQGDYKHGDSDWLGDYGVKTIEY